ncbi:uncharacterized protein LOC111369039 [Olea europaea var. sylvestris]|uniref:uncharacterized protein LOC111369039 n=1 Tax=Olea europaea var. sylvestris TaxID=158386 RepID=UPI000C1D20BC|nr:uncharacterized protein LOC111369039 [Olea europaea var. sylvestris]
MLTGDGAYTSSLDEVAYELIHFYNELLGKNSARKAVEHDIFKSGPMLTEEQAMTLVWDVLEKEVKNALFGIGAKNIGTLLVMSSLEQSKNSIIRRPIACCGVFYKVITKIFASQLGTILGMIIYQAQTTFVESRTMTENIHLTQKLLRQYNCKRVARICLLKIDLRKVYDSRDKNVVELQPEWSLMVRALSEKEMVIGQLNEGVSAFGFKPY